MLSEFCLKHTIFSAQVVTLEASQLPGNGKGNLHNAAHRRQPLAEQEVCPAKCVPSVPRWGALTDSRHPSGPLGLQPPVPAAGPGRQGIDVAGFVSPLKNTDISQ